MNPLKEKIAEKLESLNESELQEVFNFVNTMTKQNTTVTQLLPPPPEKEEVAQLKYVGGVLVVAGSGGEMGKMLLRIYEKKGLGNLLGNESFI